MGFWIRLIGKVADNSTAEDYSDDDLIDALVGEYFLAVDSNQEPDFHIQVLLGSSLVLPSIREIVPIKSWFFNIISATPVPKLGRAEALNDAIEMIDRQLHEKGLLPDRAYRNITLLRGKFIKQRRLFKDAADDMHLFGRAEKRKFATTLNLRDAIAASPLFEPLKSEPQTGEDGEYTGERFDVFCPHLNEDFDLWVNTSISDMPLEMRKIMWLQFYMCYESDLALNHALLVGPGWDVSLLGLPECCDEKFGRYLKALHVALGGEILQLPA